MLFLYLRIFTGRVFRWECFITMGVVFAWTIGSIMSTIFQCVPVAGFWDPVVTATAKCTNTDAFWYAYAIINIITDFAVLLLPLPEVKKLQLPWAQKLGVMGIFVLGLFICVTSIVRTNAVAISTSNKADSTCKPSSSLLSTPLKPLWDS
jgi:hypothetical protein